MLFGPALDAMKEGKRVRRANFAWFLELQRDQKGQPADIHAVDDETDETWLAEPYDLLAGDWEVC